MTYLPAKILPWHNESNPLGPPANPAIATPYSAEALADLEARIETGLGNVASTLGARLSYQAYVSTAPVGGPNDTAQSFTVPASARLLMLRLMAAGAGGAGGGAASNPGGITNQAGGAGGTGGGVVELWIPVGVALWTGNPNIVSPGDVLQLIFGWAGAGGAGGTTGVAGGAGAAGGIANDSVVWYEGQGGGAVPYVAQTLPNNRFLAYVTGPVGAGLGGLANSATAQRAFLSWNSTAYAQAIPGTGANSAQAAPANPGGAVVVGGGGGGAASGTLGGQGGFAAGNTTTNSTGYTSVSPHAGANGGVAGSSGTTSGLNGQNALMPGSGGGGGGGGAPGGNGGNGGAGGPAMCEIWWW